MRIGGGGKLYPCAAGNTGIDFGTIGGCGFATIDFGFGTGAAAGPGGGPGCPVPALSVISCIRKRLPCFGCSGPVEEDRLSGDGGGPPGGGRGGLELGGMSSSGLSGGCPPPPPPVKEPGGAPALRLN